jgi:hypothetical protein
MDILNSHVPVDLDAKRINNGNRIEIRIRLLSHFFLQPYYKKLTYISSVDMAVIPTAKAYCFPSAIRA